MKRICINTEDIKQKADAADAAADAIARLGDGLLQAAMRLPGYEGQLAKPTLAAGYEAQRQCRGVQSGLHAGSRILHDVARAFEDVDQQTTACFSESQHQISGSLLPLTGAAPGSLMVSPAADLNPAYDMALGEQGGSVNFGYQKVGTRYIYLFYQGTTIVIDLTALDMETLGQVYSFIDAVDDWDSTLSELTTDDREALLAVIAEFGGGALSLLSTPLTSFLGVLGAAGFWGKTIVDAGKWTKDFEEDWNALWETRSKAAGMFSWLKSSDRDGILSRPTTREETNLFVQ